MFSIRRRLTIAIAIGFAVTTIAAGALVAHLLRESVTDEFDEVLRSKSRALMTLTEQDDEGRILMDDAVGALPEYRGSRQSDYFQIWLTDGTSIYQSTPDAAALERVGITDAAYDVVLPDGRAGRAVEVTFAPLLDDGDEPSESAQPATHSVVLVVARGRERLDWLIGRVRLAVGGGCIGAILLAALLTWWLLVSGFRPIDRIADQVRKLDAESLGARIRGPTPREIAPVVEQLNALLARLEDSFSRERRFAGNVAHELRTPIAELRSLAAVGRQWPEDRAAVERFFDDVTDISSGMEAVVSDLLLLARCQAGVEPTSNTPVVLRELIESAWQRVASTAGQRGLRMECEVRDELVVEIDPGKMGIVMANLLGNAVAYARPDSVIHCGASGNGSGLELEITNEADALSEVELQRLAEPFWRRDEARSSSRHAGLGLSVVAAVTELLDLDLRFGQDESGVFRASLAGWVVSSP